MVGVLEIYKSFYRHETLKKFLPYKRSLLLISINLLIGGTILTLILYGPGYLAWGIPLTIIPGMLFILYTALLTHIALRPFSKESSFAHTLAPFAIATIPAIISWIPFVNYVAVLLSVYILIAGLALQHHIKWYKSLASLVIVSAINYGLITLLGLIFGGAA